jgi:hypothetical protein
MEAVTISVRAAPMHCWDCGAETNIVTLVEIAHGDSRQECNISGFDGYDDLLEITRSHLLAHLSLGELKLRFSKTMNQTYMSNGCSHCGALVGQHYEIHSRYDERTACAFSVAASDRWKRFLEQLAERSSD